jgi:hypothetical protein
LNENQCDPEAGGFGTGGNCIDQCWCGPACDTLADCPTPATGNVVPVCDTVNYDPGLCVLPCDGGSTCPDGMACSPAFGPPDLCMWETILEPPDC